MLASTLLEAAGRVDNVPVGGRSARETLTYGVKSQFLFQRLSGKGCKVVSEVDAGT